MTDFEKKILEIVKQGDGRGDIPWMVFIRYMGELTEEDGLSTEEAMKKVTGPDVEKAMESLCEQGCLEKRSNWNGSQMLYFVKEEGPKAKGNFMAEVLTKFANSDEETLFETVKFAASVFVKVSGMTDNKRILQALTIGANVGFGGVHSLTQKQKEFLDAFFTSIYKGDMESIYAQICRDIPENSYTLLKLFCSVGKERVGMPLLYFILCFAYIDGRPSQELVDTLEEIFSIPLLMHFMKGEPDDSPAETAPEVPQQTEMLSEGTRDTTDRVVTREVENGGVHMTFQIRTVKKDAETAAREKQAAEEKARLEEAQRKEEEEKRRKEEEAAYHRAVGEWEQKCAAVTAERNAEVEKRICQAQQDIEANAQKTYGEVCRVHRAIIKEQAERKTAAEAALATLGFFKFAEKKNQQGIIEEAVSAIEKAKTTILAAKSQCDSDIATAVQTAQKKKHAIEAAVAEVMPMPPKPKMPKHMIPENPNQKYFDAILNHMVNGQLYSVSDILMGAYGLPDNMTNQRVSAYMRQMVDMGLLVRVEEKRKAYFMLAE